MKSDNKTAENYIKNLIKTGENQQLDFKFEISDAKKIAKTFSAFANTVGGILLIGIKDNGKISGIKSDEEAYMAESAAHIFCRPTVDFKLNKFVVEGKSVLSVEIPASKNKPHLAKNEHGEWIAYVRVGDQNIKANNILLEVWKNEKNKSGTFINYGKEEKLLISFLEKNEKISLSRFMKLARINRSDAEKILINMILMKILKMEITEKSIFFHSRIVI